MHTSDLQERERLRKNILTDVGQFDVVITTFDMAKSPALRATLVQRTFWRCVVLDEGHVIKNENAIISQVVRGLHCQFAMLLTGTPLQNNLHELWSVLNFLCPQIFKADSADIFDRAFDIGNKQHSADNSLLLAAHAMLRCFMLRRLKRDVEKGVPPKLETTVFCPLSDLQKFWYKRLLTKDNDLMSVIQNSSLGECKESPVEGDESAIASVNTTASIWKRLQFLLVQLRKVCNHPYLFGDDAEDAPDGEGAIEQMVAASGKLELLDRLLVKLHQRGHRVVIFSQFTMMMDILEDYLDWRFGDFAFCRLDGSCNRVQRGIDIAAYNAPNSPLFAFLMSTRAGGLGVNLQTADTVILFDSDWNPQADLQAMARVHRIGQTKKVHVYRLVTEGTVEERIVQRAQKKLYLDQMVNRDSVAQDDAEKMDTATLLATLKFGANAIFNGSATKMSDLQLDSLIDRHAEAAGPDLQVTASNFDMEAMPVNTREFEGQLYTKNDSSAGRNFANCSDNMDNLSETLVKEAEEISSRKRKRTSRFVTDFTSGVKGGDKVLKVDYFGDEETETLRTTFREEKRQVQIAGKTFINEDFCLQCWDGGSLVCCDLCPASYHLKCIGLTKQDLSGFKWICPQHQCFDCDRKAAAVGGLLFRCTGCSKAFCEDHLPIDISIVRRNLRFQRLGFRHPAQACFIRCSAECVEYSEASEVSYQEEQNRLHASKYGEKNANQEAH